MSYRLFADALLLLHAGFVVFVMLGGLLALRWPRAAAVHLPAVAWAAAIEFLGGICPLTPLENHYRRLAGDDGYAGGFVEHYLLSMLYPDGLTRGVQYALGVLVLLANLAIYAWVWQRRDARAGPADRDAGPP